MSSNTQSKFDDRFNAVKQKNQSESNTEYTTRNIGQQAARTGETILGWPANMKKAVQNSVRGLTDFLGVPSIYDYEKKALGESSGGVEDFLMNPPTSAEIREKGTPKIAEALGLDKNYFEPRSEVERFAGDLNQDITSFFMPGTSQLRLAVRLGAPIAGNLTKEGVQYLGGSKDTAEKAKLGVMLATTLAGQSNPGEFASTRIQQAKDMIPPNMTVFHAPFNNALTSLRQRLDRGLNVSSKTRVRQGITDLESQVDAQGRIPLRNMVEARDHINEWIAEAGGWDIPGPERAAALRNLNEMKTEIINTIDQNLTRRLPHAAELYRSGYEAAAVNHRSNAITNFIERNFGKQAASVGAKLLFPGAVGGAALLPKVGIGLAGIAPIYKVGQVLYRVGRSPTLAAYYQDVIRYSLQGNASAMAKSMDKLDKALLKEEEKESKGKKMTVDEFKSSFRKKG